MTGCLLLHGFTGRLEEIESLIKYLKDETDWDIAAPILPGHGDTLNLKGKDYTLWINKAIEELQILKKRCEHVYVIGFSMGAMIAAELAARFKIDGLVLLAPAGKVLPIGKMMHELKKMLQDSRRGRIESNIMYRNSFKKIIYTPFGAFIEFLKLIKESKSYLNDINTPVLIFHGKQDALVPYQTIHNFNKTIRSSEKEIVLFQDAGHFICLEEATSPVVNRLTLKFLKEH